MRSRSSLMPTISLMSDISSIQSGTQPHCEARWASSSAVTLLWVMGPSVDRTRLATNSSSASVVCCGEDHVPQV